jgi:UDP-2-acetamido-2-deoxy-ribo-hexuluronate aminotransferase
MDALNAIAARHGGIAVIEDAAQSFGASYKQRRSCGLSTFGCTSFFPSKPLGCYGDGGAIFTDDDQLAQACREIRVHGQSSRYVHTRVGVGGRMDTLQCAVVLAKLKRFDWELAQRKSLGERYRQLIQEAGLPGLELLEVKDDRDCVWAQYTVKVDKRPQVQAGLKEAGIPTAIHYPRPLHRQPVYEHHAAGARYPVSERQAERVLSLPMSADLDPADQPRIVQALRNCLEDQPV